MTPKEKAKELVGKMDLKQMPSLNLARNEINLNDTFFNAKQCALIAVDEILNSWYPVNIHCRHEFHHDNLSTSFYEYWEEVKQEISNL